jgi:hypothetical protein
MCPVGELNVEEEEVGSSWYIGCGSFQKGNGFYLIN